MASTSNTLPGTGANGGSGNDWSAPEGIIDTDVTTYSPGTGLTKELIGTNYGFTIPTSATIKGIVWQMKRASSDASSNFTDNLIQLRKASGYVGNNKSAGAQWAINNFASPETVTFGTSTDLWGATWTPAEINNSAFGIGYKCNKAGGGDNYVWFFKIQVYYELPSGALFFSQL